MKRLLFFALLFMFCVSGCSSSKEESKPQETEDIAAAADVTTPEETATETSEPTEAPVEVSDEELAASLTHDLTGSWSYSNIDMENLTFNEDGTGTYKGISGEDLTFNYQVTVEHRAFSNGAPYDSYILNMDYSNGESEQNIFWFQNDEHTEFALHDYEDGGYNGVLNFPEYQKKTEG